MYGSCSNFGDESGPTGVTAMGIMLFGVRVMEGSFRKSASMNNLAQFEQPQESTTDVPAGYASDDIVHASARSRERKRGVPWTEEEHKLFLLGLQKVGKGDWRGISRNFVKTRTPTQVASHAQKYFLRRNNSNRRRRRSSLFDMAMEDRQIQQETVSHMDEFPKTVFPGIVKTTDKIIRPIPMVPMPPSSKLADLNLNHTTTGDLMGSLKLSSPLPSSSDQNSPGSRHSAGFHGMSGGFSSSSGDSIISVA